MNRLLLAFAALSVAGFGLGAAHARDLDNNPPGWRGGPGTDWQNRPGPQGGPWASPDRWANMPPGQREAWHEQQRKAMRQRQRLHAGNPPGPVGGPGHGPRWDRDGNPPGRRGGPGMNWENPPGWRGGPGTNWENPPGRRGGRGMSTN